jgi:hypothetical protein
MGHDRQIEAIARQYFGSSCRHRAISATGQETRRNSAQEIAPLQSVFHLPDFHHRYFTGAPRCKYAFAESAIVVTAAPSIIASFTTSLPVPDKNGKP